ncbi:ribosome biogenesis GTP-binding protein YihA/YsxC [Candidatus Phytoplasma pini]|uniref:Probable GTP-binding protein EngB n=1 Tax=Candidatus Phytoplasma pini TaxID=267362 RepID=A0A559KJW7_9MOLU|nr:ribosome biogenesis GTP-binding protein YihA/YsxC [Candidatus Phytoplasma pini]TVY12423.1 GTP-binding protein [Candidatus Phytoplasma pini]
MFKKSQFIKSIINIEDRPLPLLPEILLIGRSNVGKSSFINSLTNNKKLAFISKKPGKTSTLNYFLVENDFYLIDSPGYGYSKKKKFQKNIFPIISVFLQKNNYIKYIFQLIDFKIGLTDLDLLINQQLRQYNQTPIVILNKKDKVIKNKIINHKKRIQTKLQHDLTTHSIPIVYLFSCKTKEGLKEIIDFMRLKT